VASQPTPAEKFDKIRHEARHQGVVIHTQQAQRLRLWLSSQLLQANQYEKKGHKAGNQWFIIIHTLSKCPGLGNGFLKYAN